MALVNGGMADETASTSSQDTIPAENGLLHTVTAFSEANVDMLPDDSSMVTQLSIHDETEQIFELFLKRSFSLTDHSPLPSLTGTLSRIEEQPSVEEQPSSIEDVSESQLLTKPSRIKSRSFDQSVLNSTKDSGFADQSIGGFGTKRKSKLRRAADKLRQSIRRTRKGSRKQLIDESMTAAKTDIPTTSGDQGLFLTSDCKLHCV